MSRRHTGDVFAGATWGALLVHSSRVIVYDSEAEGEKAYDMLPSATYQPVLAGSGNIGQKSQAEPNRHGMADLAYAWYTVCSLCI
jgi:hypothetical protein